MTGLMWDMHDRTTDEQAEKNRMASMFKMEETINHPWEKEDNGRSNDGENTQVEAASTTDDVLGHGDDLQDNHMDDDPA